jgi:Helix-turn-helix
LVSRRNLYNRLNGYAARDQNGHLNGQVYRNGRNGGLWRRDFASRRAATDRLIHRWAFAIANAAPRSFCYTRRVANEEAHFRRRLREMVIQKYGSLDRFYLETDFSKGHLSQVLRGKRSPSLSTIVKLARALDVQVADFFRKL